MFLKNLDPLKITTAILTFFIVSNTINANQKDSIYSKKYNKVIFFDSDSIFYKYAQSGFLKSINEIYYYYDEIVPLMSTEKQQKEIEKIKIAAKTYNSMELQSESDFMKVRFSPTDNPQKLDKKINNLKNIKNLAINRGDNIAKLRAMENLFETYWESSMYAKAFSQALLLDKELQKKDSKNYPRKKYVYCQIGKAYYYFQDYEKAIPYLRKALEPAKYYFDTSNLEARNTIGNYFLIKEEPDSAEYYFRTALYSTEHVKDRLIYDAISLSNIGVSLAKKKDYNNAISYLEPGLSRILVDQNYDLASGVTLNIGDCYLAKNNLWKTKQMIDSANIYIQRSHNIDLYSHLYLLKCQYFHKTGNTKQAEIYLDSVMFANKAYEKKYSSLNILRAEQETYEADRQAKNEQIKQNEIIYRNRLLYSISIIIIVSIALLILGFLLRKNKKAFRALVLKNQDWAEVVPPVKEVSEKDEDSKEEENVMPTEDDKALAKAAHDLLVYNKTFKNIDITLDSLAKDLDVNRNYLSKAINKTTGKNFNTYLNEFRVKEAIKLMSDKKMSLLSIDAIALEVGFGNRITFYQAFKKITGLSPSAFRDNKA